MSRWILVFLLLRPAGLNSTLPSAFVVWNVGQGSWSTLFWREQCLHFDMGGEFFPRPVSDYCRQRKNYLFLSHDDWDHVSFIPRVQTWPSICLAKSPRRISSPSREKFLKKLKPCPSTNWVQEIAFTPDGSTANDLSRVYWLPQLKILLPGDSTQKQEKRWGRFFEQGSIKWWLLGHHGSQTSNSRFLIDRVHRVRGAVASARFQRYGHPHAKVIGRLRSSGIPALTTQDWGNIWIGIREEP